MDPDASRRILKNLVFIKENITQIGKVMDKLIENDYITMDEKADILTERSIDNQCHMVLETVIKKGEKAFKTFVDALKMSGNGHVADKIMQTELNSHSDEHGLNRDDTVTFEIADRQEEIINLIKERELYRTRLDELMKKYKKLKTENQSKANGMEALQKEINELRDRAFPQEKKTKESGTQMDRSCREFVRAQKAIPKVTKGDVVDGPTSTSRDSDKMEEQIQENLMDKLEQQTMTIEELMNEATFYNNRVGTLEDQIKDLKVVISEKDDKIMNLKHTAGKLQVYLEAGKHERERLSSELRIQLEKNQKDNEDRFNRLDDKMDQVMKYMMGNTVPRNTMKPVESPYLLEVTPIKSPRNNRQNKYNKKFR